MEKILNYINGEIVEPVSQKYIDNYNPSKGEIYSQIPDSGKEDVNKAVIAAQNAFPQWKLLSNERRAGYLMQIADLIDNNLNDLAKAETIDNGKPLWLSKKVDIPRSSSNFRFYATGIMHYNTRANDMQGKALNYTLRRPIGVTACISPWNLPLYLFTWKIAPALASGNCVVAKPSEITPMTAYLLSKLCIEAGLPKGVLNIVHGYGNKVGDAITGGTKTGAEISRIAAPKFKKLSLELGGKNPGIIYDDCDFEKTVSVTANSSFTNQGEICLCSSRLFVHKNIYDKFKKAFVEKVKSFKVGDPFDENNKLGAIVSKQHFEKIMSYIDLAQQEGGKILCGGKQVKMTGELENGWYIEPTIIEGLPYDCRTNQEEIFGPVTTLTPFEDYDEVIKYANSTQYGLSATVWTENLNRAHKTAEALDVGIVWVNCWLLRDLRTPFGGVKGSGIGREGGFEAFDFFTEQKNVCIKF